MGRWYRGHHVSSAHFDVFRGSIRVARKSNDLSQIVIQSRVLLGQQIHEPVRQRNLLLDQHVQQCIISIDLREDLGVPRGVLLLAVLILLIFAFSVANFDGVSDVAGSLFVDFILQFYGERE